MRVCASQRSWEIFVLDQIVSVVVQKFADHFIFFFDIFNLNQTLIHLTRIGKSVQFINQSSTKRRLGIHKNTSPVVVVFCNHQSTTIPDVRSGEKMFSAKSLIYGMLRTKMYTFCYIMEGPHDERDEFKSPIGV